MKRRTRKSFSILLAVAMVFTMYAPTGSTKLEAASKPKLNKSKATLYKGKSTKLLVKGVKSKKIKSTSWSTNKKSVAKLTAKGKTAAVVKAVKKGKAVITCKIKIGKKTTTKKCTITVKEKATPKPEETDEPDETDEPEPTDEPTLPPAQVPTQAPTAEPTPIVVPTEIPTEEPTKAPEPTVEPTIEPTVEPTVAPTNTPVPTQTIAPTSTPTVEPSVKGIDNPSTNAEGTTTWNSVYFGNYLQGTDVSTEKTPILWRVLSIEGSEALLMADNILDAAAYDTDGKAEWADSSLRTWLNKTFLNNAFSEKEQEAILETEVANETSNNGKLTDGVTTKDKVYLLSLAEAKNKKYGFNGQYAVESQTRYGQATEYARDKGVGSWMSLPSEYRNSGTWWLRSPGEEQGYAADVSYNGFVNEYGECSDYKYDGVRPVLRVDLTMTDWKKGQDITATGGGDVAPTPDPLNPTPEPLTKRTSVSGHISTAGGTDAANLRVVLTREDGAKFARTITTDDKGEFSTKLPAGNYYGHIVNKSTRLQQDIKVGTEALTDLDLSIDCYRVSGTIVDKSGDAMPNLSLNLYPKRGYSDNTVTDDKGQFTMYMTKGVSFCIISEGATLHQGTTSGGDLLNLKITYPDYATYTGKLTTALGDAMPNETIFIYGSKDFCYEVKTDSEGYYRVKLVKGTYELFLNAYCYDYQMDTINVTENKEVAYDINSKLYEISGTIADAKGNPVTESELGLRIEKNGSYYDYIYSQGSFFKTYLPAGAYTMEYQGYVIGMISVTNQNQNNVVLTLPNLCTVAVNVTTATGGEATNYYADFDFRDTAGASHIYESDVENFKLAPGTYSIYQNDVLVKAGVVIPDEASCTVDVQLNVYKMTGTLKRTDGTALTGRSMILINDTQFGIYTDSSTGEFQVYVAPGEYQLKIDTSMGWKNVKSVTVTNKDIQDDIVYDLYSVSAQLKSTGCDVEFSETSKYSYAYININDEDTSGSVRSENGKFECDVIPGTYTVKWKEITMGQFTVSDKDLSDVILSKEIWNVSGTYLRQGVNDDYDSIKIQNKETMDVCYGSIDSDTGDVTGLYAIPGTYKVYGWNNDIYLGTLTVGHENLTGVDFNNLKDKPATTASPVIVPTTIPTAIPFPSTSPTTEPVVTPVTTCLPIETTEPTATPVNVVDGNTVDETETCPIALTELNEGTMTCDAKRPEPNGVHDNISYNKDGSVTFTSNKDYNSGVQYYLNPCTDESQITDVEDREGYKEYTGGMKDISGYDYIRVKVTSDIELNFRTYDSNDTISNQGFPGETSSETYEGCWIGPISPDDYMSWGSMDDVGMNINEEYRTRTLFIPIRSLITKGCNPEKAVAVALCPHRENTEVTIHSMDLIKVNYDVQVSSIDVSAGRNEIYLGNSTSCYCYITPSNASRQIVTWSSSDESIATVDASGRVEASDTNTGTVTITATATDGSKVYGTTEITVKDPQDEKPMKSHIIDLTSPYVTANGNDGSGATDATKSTDGIAFETDNNMAYVNFSKYLDTYKLSLSDYASIEVTYAVKDAEGKVISENTGCIYGKVALVSANKLNGYDSGINGWLNNFTSATKSISLWNRDIAEVLSVAGINFQMASIPEGCHMEISKIKLVKDYNVYTDLSSAEITAGGNNGEYAESVTQSATSIEFPKNVSMAYVDFSKYLAMKGIDLTEYQSISVGYKVVDEDDTLVTENEGCTYGKVALVPANKLNGYDRGINGWMNNFVFDTKTVSLVDRDTDEVAAVAGFNLQLQSVPKDCHIVVTGITFNKSYDVTIPLDSEDVEATGNSGSVATPVTQSTVGIEFTADTTMTSVHFSNYLTSNGLRLGDYDAVSVTYQVQDIEGNVVTANDACTSGKVALVPSIMLNGYEDGINGKLDNFVEGTKKVIIAGQDGIGAIDGFNFQLQKIPAGTHIVIKEIKLIYDGAEEATVKETPIISPSPSPASSNQIDYIPKYEDVAFYKGPVTEAAIGVDVDLSSSDYTAVNFGLPEGITSGDQIKSMKFFFKASDIEDATKDLKLTFAAIDQKASGSWDESMDNHGRLFETYGDISMDSESQTNGDMTYDSETGMYTWNINFAARSLLTKDMGYYMLSRNGEDSTAITLNLQKVQFTLYADGESDPVLDYPMISIPYEKTFADESDGLDQQMQCTYVDTEYRDTEGVDGSGCLWVKGNNYKGVTLLVQNTDTTKAKDFYFEAAVKAADKDSLDGKVIVTEEYSDYKGCSNQGTTVDAMFLKTDDFHTMHDKFSVPAGSFVELQFKGSKAFLLDNVIVRELAESDDVSDDDYPEGEAKDYAFGKDVVADMTQTPHGYSYDYSQIEGGYSIDFSGQYAEVQFELPENVSLPLATKFLATMEADSNVAVKLYNQDGDAVKTFYNNTSDCSKDILSTDTTEVITKIGFMSQDVGTTNLQLTGIKFQTGKESFDLSKIAYQNGISATDTTSITFTEKNGEVQYALPVAVPASSISEVAIQMEANECCSVTLLDENLKVMGPALENIKANQTIDMSTYLTGDKTGKLAYISIMSRTEGTEATIQGITVTALDTTEEPTEPTDPTEPTEPTTDKVPKSHEIDLSSDDISAATNGGGEATKSSNGIAYDADQTMVYVDFSKYLTANELKLTEFGSIEVTYAVKDSSDETITANEACEFGKVGLVSKSEMNGYANGIVGYLNAFTSGTKSVSLRNQDTDALNAVDGFNFQLASIPEGSHIEISSVCLVKDYNTYVDLSAKGIVANGNDGSGEVTPVTQSATSIEFTKGNKMVFVNFAEYLKEQSIDLTEYKSVSVGYKVVDSAGKTITDNEDCIFGKLALVPVGKINGYDDNGVRTWLSDYTSGTEMFSLEDVSKSDVAEFAGINLQLSNIPSGTNLVITGITFNRDYNVTLPLDSTSILGRANNGEGELKEATQTSEGISFLANQNLTCVDFSKYLEENSISLSDYDFVKVAYKLVDADGIDVSENADCTFGKVAFVPAANLNGYLDGVTNFMSDFVNGSLNCKLSDQDSDTISAVAGFNLQLERIPTDTHIVITEISLIYTH